MITTTHDSDFYTWTQEQAALLRQGRLTELDITSLIEEMEDMGRSEHRELENRLAVLLMHLLKWQYQPKRRWNSWRLTIEEQRQKSRRVLSENPGLKSSMGKILQCAYADARLSAAKETKLEKSVFPVTCTWPLESIFDDDYWPE